MVDGFVAFVLAVFVWGAYTDQQEELQLQVQMQEIIDRLYEEQTFEKPTNTKS